MTYVHQKWIPPVLYVFHSLSTVVCIVFSYLYYLLEQNGILANPNYNISVVIIQFTMDALLLPLNLKIRIQSKHSRKNHCSITVSIHPQFLRRKPQVLLALVRRYLWCGQSTFCCFAVTDSKAICGGYAIEVEVLMRLDSSVSRFAWQLVLLILSRSVETPRSTSLFQIFMLKSLQILGLVNHTKWDHGWWSYHLRTVHLSPFLQAPWACFSKYQVNAA